MARGSPSINSESRSLRVFKFWFPYLARTGPGLARCKRVNCCQQFKNFKISAMDILKSQNPYHSFQIQPKIRALKNFVILRRLKFFDNITKMQGLIASEAGKIVIDLFRGIILLLTQNTALFSFIFNFNKQCKYYSFLHAQFFELLNSHFVPASRVQKKQFSDIKRLE